MLTLDSKVVATERHVCTDLDGEATILNLNSGKYYGLADVGARVWELLAEPVTVRDLEGRILDEFEVSPQQCHADLLRLLQSLTDEGLIHIES